MASSIDVWLWLLLVMGPHNPKTNFILNNNDNDATRTAKLIRDGNLNILDERERQRAAEVRRGQVNELKKQCADKNVRILTLDDEEYPELLRSIDTPPIVLFAAGDLKGLNDRLCIASVGTRRVTEYGKKVTEAICGSLASTGAVIISGMAVGADAAAHNAALEVGGKTAAVLGCGILVNYPKDNARLKRRIVENGGVIISELLPHAVTKPYYFHIRNRIISGMSHGVLVTEAGETSGSLITANCALEQGREVFCIPPHDIFSKSYSGLSALLRDGAVPVFSHMDILDAFQLLNKTDAPAKAVQRVDISEKSVRARQTARVFEKYAREESVPEEQKPVEKRSAAKPRLDAKDLSKLSPCEAEIVKQLFKSPCDEDTLIDRTGFDFAEVSEALTSLEIAALIVRNMDGTFEPMLEN